MNDKWPMIPDECLIFKERKRNYLHRNRLAFKTGFLDIAISICHALTLVSQNGNNI